MQSFIEFLKKQDNRLLKNEGKGIELFKSLRHTKTDLDNFLRYVVAEIFTSSKKVLVCTSNEMLVKKFSPIKQIGNTLNKTTHSSFETSIKHSALTWDLLKNKYASISGDGWQILNFIVIDESNIDILHEVITALLKK